MAKYYGLWWGGHSYSQPSIEDGDLEVFASVAAAQRTLLERYESNGIRHCTVRRANGDTEETLFPAVSQDSEIHLYFADPRESSDPYPDRRIFLRLAAVVEHC